LEGAKFFSEGVGTQNAFHDLERVASVPSAAAVSSSFAVAAFCKASVPSAAAVSSSFAVAASSEVSVLPLELAEAITIIGTQATLLPWQAAEAAGGRSCGRQ